MVEPQNQKIIIVGGGLCGSLLSIMMAKRGFKVDVYERRPDMRVATSVGGRSINLALSKRGIHALEQVGLTQAILSKAVAMKGRMTHDLLGNTLFQPYGKDQTEYINSIPRGGLNMILMDEAQKYPNITYHFNQLCIDYDPEYGAKIYNESADTTYTVNGDIIIGTDGSASAIRDSLNRIKDISLNQIPLEHGYKELTVLPDTAGNFRMDGESLHIWPRKSYMLIALPNLDRSFTCTLFYPNKGEASFEQLTNATGIKNFFETNFPDLLPLIPDLETQFLNNPLGNLGTVKCYPWTDGSKVLLMGDAAHAVVPFYGQGMNCSFEDCVVFDDILGKIGTKWGQVFSMFQISRKTNTDAIADLALENFIEMRDKTADPIFQKKRKLELKLETQFPGKFLSKYAMVTFHRIPYSRARLIGNMQDEFLTAICEHTEDIESLDPNQLIEDLQQYVESRT